MTGNRGRIGSLLCRYETHNSTGVPYMHLVRLQYAGANRRLQIQRRWLECLKNPALKQLRLKPTGPASPQPVATAVDRCSQPAVVASG